MSSFTHLGVQWRELKEFTSRDNKAGIRFFISGDKVLILTMASGKTLSLVIPRKEALDLFSSLVSNSNSKEIQDKTILNILKKRAGVDEIVYLKNYHAVLNEFIQVMPKVSTMRDFGEVRGKRWFLKKKE